MLARASTCIDRRSDLMPVLWIHDIRAISLPTISVRMKRVSLSGSRLRSGVFSSDPAVAVLSPLLATSVHKRSIRALPLPLANGASLIERGISPLFKRKKIGRKSKGNQGKNNSSHDFEFSGRCLVVPLALLHPRLPPLFVKHCLFRCCRSHRFFSIRFRLSPTKAAAITPRL